MADETKAVEENKKTDAPKPEKKRLEMAVFSPTRPFSYKGRLVELYKNVDNSPITLRLSHNQVLDEIKKGKTDGRQGKKVRPISPVLNHCTLVSADETTEKTLKRFWA